MLVMSSIERLLYTSLATEPLGTLDLFNLLNQARERNAALGITGHLLYAKGQFTQCIEGPSACVEQLWQRLLKDHRHAEVQLLSRQTIESRRFADWSMAFSSYRYLNTFNMPGFFPIDEDGVNEQVRRCLSD
jgi:hypothetical protein